MASDNNGYYEVKTIRGLIKDIGKTKQAYYIKEYLKDLKVKSYIVEYNYIDKDFLIDYTKFYARAFTNKDGKENKYTKRLHFFNEIIPSNLLEDLLKKYSQEKHNFLQEHYLGFVVVRPIEDEKNRKLLGRVLLKTYPQTPIGATRKHLTIDNEVLLFGIQLTIQTLPFWPQDGAVGGCATSACWVAQFPLNKLFGIQKYSPYELTELSINHPGLGKNFPSSGLTNYQMKSQFNTLGLDTEYIVLEEINDEYYSIEDDLVADIVKAYTSLGLPIIASLILIKPDGNRAYHAVVISGYRYENNRVTELYIHDDQIGPYSKVFPAPGISLKTTQATIKPNFIFWNNEWITKFGFKNVIVQELIIPIYPKLRLNFGRIYRIYLKTKRYFESKNKKNGNDYFTTDLLLTDHRTLKINLKTKQFRNKAKFMMGPLPRYIWLIRIKYKNTIVYDGVYDGTAVYAKLLFEIIYDQLSINKIGNTIQ